MENKQYHSKDYTEKMHKQKQSRNERMWEKHYKSFGIKRTDTKDKK